MCRAALQKAVRKSAGGRAHVETNLGPHIDLPVIERALQLQSAAADIPEILPEQADRCIVGDLRAGFLHFLIIHQHIAGENQRLRAFTRPGETTVDEQFVESDFQLRIPPQVLPRKCQHPHQCKVLKRLSDKPLTKILLPFSTAFSTNVLKTSVHSTRERCPESCTNKRAARKGGCDIWIEQGSIPQLLPAISDQCRSWSARSARRPDLRALP